MKDTHKLIIGVPVKTMKGLRKLAESDGRVVKNYIEWVLVEHEKNTIASLKEIKPK